MASEAQVKANRKNSKKSPGPRTRAGKARASGNSLKHGLFARDALTPDECPADYEAFRNDALSDLKPVGFLETEQAETIINTRWRLRRCERIEAGLFGGGKHVMEEIEATSIEKFARTREPIVRPKDWNLSHTLQDVMFRRIGEDIQQRFRTDPSVASGSAEDRCKAAPDPRVELRRTNSSGNTEYQRTSTKDVPFSDVPNEDLLEELLRACEEERQKNPLSYDIALAFKRDLSGDAALTKLAQNEGALDRKLHRAIEQFQRLQTARKAEAAETATVIDVTDLNKEEG